MADLEVCTHCQKAFPLADLVPFEDGTWMCAACKARIDGWVPRDLHTRPTWRMGGIARVIVIGTLAAWALVAVYWLAHARGHAP